MSGISNLQQDKYGLKTIFHVVVGLIIFIAVGALATSSVKLLRAAKVAEPSILFSVVRPTLVIVVLLLVVCLYISKVLKRPLSDFRMGKPKHIALWGACALILPLAVAAFYIFLTPGNFASSNAGMRENSLTILYVFFGTFLTAGVIEETIFRGLIMRVLEIRFGKVIAVIVPSIVFALMHIGNAANMHATDIALLIIAGTAVGSMFSLIAMQSGSIVASALVHGAWNMILGGKILSIATQPEPSIFTYKLTSDANLLTGGAFGIDAALPAIIGYGSVIALALYLMRKGDKSAQ
ncbi:MAG: CPBP family intramembrane metalloprotease [Propionibacteriaceae bacterium]|jgi:membrane protease YdiL (CAAX protease family)|nr:CPBP family intramembrane metalloprotease [Propionibacteriaceae bacterium]